MTDWIGVPTLIGQAKIAAAIGGAPLALATLRVGDGNGAAITPLETMTTLVRQVASYPVAESARDAVNTSMWRVTAHLPLADGPFVIREIGVFDAAGDMIAIAQHPVVEKQAGVNDGEIGMIFVVGVAANLAVTISPAAQISLAQMLRSGWITVDGELTAPPVTPAVGATYLVGAAATGAWVGQTGLLAQWTGLVWSFAAAPNGHYLCDNSKALDAATRLRRRDGGAWVNARATETALGYVALASGAIASAGEDNERALTAASMRAKLLPGFRAVSAKTQSVPSSVITNLTDWVISDSNLGDATFAAGVLTVGASTAGLWLVEVVNAFQSATMTQAYFVKNNALVGNPSRSATVNGNFVIVSGYVRLAAGDTLDARGWQNGSTAQVNAFQNGDGGVFTAVRISA